MLTLQEKSLDWALAHVETCGDTDVFPTPFEYKAIRHDWDTLKPILAEQDVLNWTVRPSRTLLAPKARYGFRVMTQLDPLDFLLFAATIREICSAMENGRIPRENNVVFSYRVSPDKDGRLFDREIGYRNFLEASRRVLVEDSSVSHVVVTDISDFYSRIYLHRLENALGVSGSQTNHVKAIMHLLTSWNNRETYGIPVGNAPSRLLAELTINNVDQTLLANGVQFIRFNDDYRIFVHNYPEGYRTLALLAECLHRQHGLTLQQHKTQILPRNEFDQRFLSTPLDREIDSLHNNFDELASSLGLNDPYDPIDYEGLSDELKELIDSWNLQGMLMEQVHSDEELDAPLVRFLLRRLGQLRDSSQVDELLENIDRLYTAFPSIIRYIGDFTSHNSDFRFPVGRRLLSIYEDSIVSELDYHKLWCLHPFAESQAWDQQEHLVRLYNEARDDTSKRELILAMGRAGLQHWFQMHWRNLMDFPHWSRRAFLAGASCMPPDARRHWYDSVLPQLDWIERAIVRWARQNPFLES